MCKTLIQFLLVLRETMDYVQHKVHVGTKVCFSQNYYLFFLAIPVKISARVLAVLLEGFCGFSSFTLGKFRCSSSGHAMIDSFQITTFQDFILRSLYL
jgi:hypothetical protein